MRSKYLFDHIPKTGGMSMKAIFDDLFGPENVSAIIHWENAAQIMAQLEAKVMITGHFWHPPGSLVNRRRAYLTVLRQPEERTVSLYYFFRNNAEDVETTAVQRARAMDLEAFLLSDEPAILETIQNFLVRHFKQLSVAGYSATTDDRQALALARQVIEDYDFVGIQEEFADSVDMMCYRFGWPAVERIPDINRTRERKGLDELPGRLRARLRDLNALDIELYDHARRLFADRKRAMMRRWILLRNTGQEPEVDVAARSAVEAPPGGPPLPAVFGDRGAEILGVEIEGARSGGAVVQSGEEAVIRISTIARERVEDFTAGIAILDSSRQTVFGTNSHRLGERWAARPDMAYEIEFRLRMDLGEGTYFVTAALHTGPGHFDRCFHWWEEAASFEVRGLCGSYFQGRVNLSPRLSCRESPPLGSFAADLSSEALPGTARAGETLSIPLRLRNTGDRAWPAGNARPVHVSYHWLETDGKAAVFDGRRTPLPGDLEPGAETVLEARVQAPDQPGIYVLRITLVQEHVAWFEDRGMRPLDAAVSVSA